MIYTKTSYGAKALKERSSLFSSRQRSAFILFDGKRTVDQILNDTSGIGFTQNDLTHMIDQGFLITIERVILPTFENVNKSTIASTSIEVTILPELASSKQERYKNAKSIATQLTVSLGFRGFLLNLAVESADGYEDLKELYPKIRYAVGTKASRTLYSALYE